MSSASRATRLFLPLLAVLAAQAFAAPPAGMTCSASSKGGHQCWDNCKNSSGATVSGHLSHDGLWHDGSCALTAKPTGAGAGATVDKKAVTGAAKVPPAPAK